MVARPIQVLLVEDDEDDYLLIRDLLIEVPDQQFELDWVNTFEQAIQQVQTQLHDVYLVDYRLGEHDGLALMALVHEKMPHAPVIILSGQGDRNLDIAALRSGAADYLNKADLRSSLLEHYIRVAIERNQAVMALQNSEQRYRTLFERENHLRQELDRSNAELEDFAYVASHELQELLRAIAGHVNLLENRLQEEQFALLHDPVTQEYIDFVIDGTERLQNLVQGLLAYSRVGTQALVLSDVDCNEVLAVAIASLQSMIDETQATIHGPDNLPQLKADQTQMQQLFQNLLSNALKYHYPGVPPQITLQVEASSPNQWKFQVTDNGIGIDPQYTDRVFRIFKRLHTQREFEGTGLGLALCRKIVERHGGQIWIESQLRAGTSVWFSLPSEAPQ